LIVPPILSAHKIEKNFGGVAALSGVHFEIQMGEIHAVCGENGAGKSTLMKILSGQIPNGNFQGSIKLDGQSIKFRNVRDAEQCGIAIVHQEFALIDGLTVAENILLGSFPKQGCWIDWVEIYSLAQKILNQFQITVPPETRIEHLGISQQQLVEIARALNKQPRILILDEPTAALSEAESEFLLTQLRELCRLGVSCIYISHKLEEVKEIADRITILRDGRSITTLSASQVTIPEIIHHMVGQEISSIFPQRHERQFGNLAIQVRELHVTCPSNPYLALSGINLSVREGEILGIGGLIGAGRSELLMHLFGLWGDRIAGEVLVNNVNYDEPDPCKSLELGIALITEDRKRFGLIQSHSTNHNLSLSSLKSVVDRGSINIVAEKQRNSSMLQKLRFRSLEVDVLTSELSGGNQQKVVLGRALLTNPSIVLLDEPTRGIDVAAKLEIYEELHELTRYGKAVIVVSSELNELIGISDRIVMMHQGKVVRTFEREEFDQSQLLAAAFNAN